MFTDSELYNCWTGGTGPTSEELRRYDALEVNACRDVSEEEDEGTWYEKCDPADAEIWSVYLHLKTGGVDCLTDCATRERATDIANHLGTKWSMPVTYR